LIDFFDYPVFYVKGGGAVFFIFFYFKTDKEKNKKNP